VTVISTSLEMMGKQIYLTADEFFKEFIGKEITLIVQEK